MDKVREDTVLRHAIPAAANATYKKDDKVLVWRENRVNNLIH